VPGFPRDSRGCRKSGQSREQASFPPPRIEDYVARDNPVRAIDAYVDLLDLMALGLRDVGSDGGAGQPPRAGWNARRRATSITAISVLS
jgi:hypothetical protein